MLVTRPVNLVPTGYLAETPSQGSASSCFMPRLMRWVSGLKRITCTCTCRSEEHTSELQSLMRISYAVFCLKKKSTTFNERETYQKKTNKNTRKKKAKRTISTPIDQKQQDTTLSHN